jgi:hypothetical protein
MCICICVVVLLMGCSNDGHQTSSKELTRDSAKRLLDNSPDWRVFQDEETLSNGVVSCGIREGLWVMGGPSGKWDMDLTSKGKTAFTRISSGFRMGNDSIWFRSKRHVVEVSGIKDYGLGTSTKLVDYSWIFDTDGWPTILKPCLIPSVVPTQQSAIFTLYDDGWRVSRN